LIRMSLGEIASVTGGAVHGDSLPVVTGPVVIDSRRVEPGALFAALVGEHVDGHDYAVAAAEAGAIAVLCSRPVPGPHVLVSSVQDALAALARYAVSRLPEMTIVGITGSSGKTSTKDLTGALLERLGPTVAPEGSMNNELGLPLTVLRASSSTRYLVLEMSARGVGHIAWLCDVAPPVIGAVLNVGQAHVGEFGSVEGIAKAKGELVEALPASGVAVLNADDPRVLAMADRTRARVVTFAVSAPTPASAGASAGAAPADFTASDVWLDELARPSFTLGTPAGSAPVRMLLHGAHHVPNALAAAAIAFTLGMPVADIAAGLSEVTARSKRRMELHRRASDDVLVINDAYNANPDSVRAAIEALAHLTSGSAARGFAVLGYMAELGPAASESHTEAGKLAAQAGLAGVIAVGPDARAVASGAASVAGWNGEAIWVPDNKAAIASLRDRLRPSDVVLVKASRVAALWEVADALLEEGTRCR
jgi:UDP-N-acetylmuramoyl-tripeptide--D-alanyl-D-alanine ligase